MALVSAYHIDPVRADWSGKADPHPAYGVSEIITVAFALPIKASLFVGAKQGDGAYDVNIYSYPDGNVALAQAVNVPVTGSYYWLNCSLTVAHPDSFIKGRKVEVRWTRSGPDSIQYYWAEDPNSPTGTGPYKYGQMIVGGTGQAV